MDNRTSLLEPSVKPKFHLQNSKVSVYAENAIKKSNVKAFVSQPLRVSQKLDIESTQNKNLSQHLLHLKNTCNDLKKGIADKENDALKLKDQTSFTHQKLKQLQTQREKIEERIANLTQDVELVLTKKQSTFHTFKTYQHILWRMKKDQITNQIRKNHLQKQITTMEKELKFIENKLYSIKQYEELSVKGLREAEEQILNETCQRNKKVHELSLILQDNKTSQTKKQQRQKQTRSIQEMAAGDLQDAQLIRMKKFFEVQLFLKYVLKDKMQKLKDYYEPYELAFLKIKSQTTAKDANSLKIQFFNFQTQFHERTAWIKHLEDEISDLEKQRNELSQEWTKERQCELDLLDEYQSNKPFELRASEGTRSVNDKDHIFQKSMDAELILMKVKEWVSFQSKRISLKHGGSIQGHNSVGSCFSKIRDFLLDNKIKQNQQNQEIEEVKAPVQQL